MPWFKKSKSEAITRTQVVIPFKDSTDVPDKAYRASRCPPTDKLPDETPIEYVQRQIGGFYSTPFVNCLAGWSGLSPQVERPYPRTGSFNDYEMDLADRMVNKGMGDPEWDLTYMKQALQGWVSLKPAWDRGHTAAVCMSSDPIRANSKLTDLDVHCTSYDFHDMPAVSHQFPFLRINDKYVLKPLDFSQMN